MHFGACRFIWNYMLDLQNKRQINGEKLLSFYDMEKLLTPLKREEQYKWLNKISNTTLCRTISVLSISYSTFFKKHAGHPKFKSRKKAKPNFRVSEQIGKFYFSKGFVQIPKIGHVKYKTDFLIPQGRTQKFCNPRVSYINGKYILSFTMQCENQTHTLNDESMGIDLGIKELAVVAFGDKQIVFHNINKSKKIRMLEKKLKHTNRTISRKYECSKERTGRYEKTKNIEREEEKLKKLYARMKGIRHNYLHQTTHALVSMLPTQVVMEDLDVSKLMDNKHLRKPLQEQCLYEFIRQMKYKCEWNEIEFIQVSRFFPSSKTCSRCGYKKKNLKLSERVYSCEKCGLKIDRDYNAAINLMRYADLQTQTAV